MDIDVGLSFRFWMMVRFRVVWDMVFIFIINVRVVVEFFDGCSVGIGDGIKSIEDVVEGCFFLSCSFLVGYCIVIEVFVGELSEF